MKLDVPEGKYRVPFFCTHDLKNICAEVIELQLLTYRLPLIHFSAESIQVSPDQNTTKGTFLIGTVLLPCEPACNNLTKFAEKSNTPFNFLIL